MRSTSLKELDDKINLFQYKNEVKGRLSLGQFVAWPIKIKKTSPKVTPMLAMAVKEDC